MTIVPGISDSAKAEPPLSSTSSNFSNLSSNISILTNSTPTVPPYLSSLGMISVENKASPSRISTDIKPMSAASIASAGIVNDEDLHRLGHQTVEYCAVCGDVADGYHYGCLSCRGCNAFFRRAITFDLQFVCRRGGNCVIDKNARCACRACRLNKCKLVGMDRNAVQLKKIPNPQQLQQQTAGGSMVKRGRLPSDMSYFSEMHRSPTVAEAVTDNAVIGSPESAFTPLNLVHSNATGMDAGLMATLTASGCPGALLTMLPSSSSALSTASISSQSSTSSAPASMPPCYLSTQVEIYHEQRKCRRILLCHSLEEMLNPLIETKLRTSATFQDLVNVYNVQMGLMFEWVEKLDDFRLITVPADKVRLLKHFAMKYFLLDNVCHTVELNYTDRIVLANNTYIVPNSQLPFPDEPSAPAKQALKLIYGDNCTRMINELVRPMIEMGITYGEMLALRLIIFWNPGSIGLSPKTVEIVQRASERAIKELHRWFDAAKIENVQTRLGSVLLLLSPVSNHTQFFLDCLSLVPSFGRMPDWDVFLSDLLR